jgi:thiol-disulfide isomerase/thioredoxin
VTHDNASSEGSLREDQARLMFGEGFSFSGYERDALFLAVPGRKFYDISGCSGIDHVSDGRAAVFADFDNDGDTDVFMTTIQGESHLLFRNNVGQDRRFLRVELEGAAELGRDAFGAVARIRLADRVLTKVKSGGMGYLSQHDPRLHFGLGDLETVPAIEVTWPGGAVEAFSGPFAAGSTIRLTAGTGRAEVIALKTARLPDPLTREAKLARSLRIAVGRPFPDLAVTELDGAVTSTARIRRPGRRTLVNLWATWCAPCRREMPELQALHARLLLAGVDLVGLSVDLEPAADVAGFVREAGVTYPIYRGRTDAVEALFATDQLSVPLSVLVDEHGTVTQLIDGWSERTRRAFEDLATAR